MIKTKLKLESGEKSEFTEGNIEIRLHNKSDKRKDVEIKIK